jgi:hypothetical protein
MNEPSIDPHANEPATPPAAPAPPPDFKLTPDGNKVTVGDKSYIREEALHQERTRAQNLQAQIDQLAPLMPEFEQFLTSKQSRDAARTARVAPPVADDQYSQDELEGLATIRGYLDAEGRPDVARARQDLAFVDRIVEQRVGKAVAPVARETAEVRAARNREAARGRQFSDGRPVADQRFVDMAFDALPPELAADPNVANIAQVIAVGLQTLDARKNGRTASREPVFTEAPNSRFEAAPGQLSAFDLVAARARGKTPEQWAKLTGAAEPQRASRTGEQADGSFVFEEGF